MRSSPLIVKFDLFDLLTFITMHSPIGDVKAYDNILPSLEPTTEPLSDQVNNQTPDDEEQEMLRPNEMMRSIQMLRMIYTCIECIIHIRFSYKCLIPIHIRSRSRNALSQHLAIDDFVKVHTHTTLHRPVLFTYIIIFVR